MCALLPNPNDVSVRQTLKQHSQEISCVVCAPSPTLHTHTHFPWTWHLQAGELKLLNKSPLLKDHTERTNFESKSLKSRENASYALCLGAISSNFRWLKVKGSVQGAHLGCSTTNEKHEHLEKVTCHFRSNPILTVNRQECMWRTVNDIDDDVDSQK